MKKLIIFLFRLIFTRTYHLVSERLASNVSCEEEKKGREVTIKPRKKFLEKTVVVSRKPLPLFLK